MKHEAEFEGEAVDMGPAQSKGPNVDLDGMRARPMQEDEPRSKAKGKGADQGWFERMRTAITSDYGFQKGRRKAPAPVKKPEFSFLEIFYRYAADKNGQERKLSMKERFLRGYQMGQWMMDNGLGKAGALAQRLFKRGKYAPEPFDPLPAGDLEMNAEEDSKKFEEQMAKGEAKSRAQQEKPEEETTFWKREDERGPGSSASNDRVRVYPTQHDTRRQVGSERVGPERQVVRNDGPWPLDRPSAKEMPERKSLPKPAEAKSKDATATPEVKSKGEAASDRGRAAAHEVHERKSQARAAARKVQKAKGAER